VVDKDAKISGDAAVQERLYRVEASKLMDQIIEKNTEQRAISIVLEFAVGKVHETIQRMVSHSKSRLLSWNSSLCRQSLDTTLCDEIFGITSQPGSN